MAKRTAHEGRLRRHARIRKKVSGTPQRPRLAVFRSNTHIYAQVIDDTAGRTLVAASDLDGALSDVTEATKSERAKRVGALVAQRAKAAGVESVVFDRGGFTYSGRVRLLADAAREEGLDF
jgi:large subunit ribosomal protein L18